MIFNRALSNEPVHCISTEIILPAVVKDSTGLGAVGLLPLADAKMRVCHAHPLVRLGRLRVLTD